MCSFLATAATGSPRPGLFAAQLLRLSCPDPALADTLAPDSFSLRDGHHPGAAPGVAPLPNYHLVQSAAVGPCELRHFLSWIYRIRTDI